jgi:hypothetical protein
MLKVNERQLRIAYQNQSEKNDRVELFSLIIIIIEVRSETDEEEMKNIENLESMGYRNGEKFT